MKHLVSYSGGKDSGGLLCWAKETLGEPGINWIPAFWNTRRLLRNRCSSWLEAKSALFDGNHAGWLLALHHGWITRVETDDYCRAHAKIPSNRTGNLRERECG